MGETLSKVVNSFSPKNVANNVRTLVRKRKREDDEDTDAEANLVLEKTLRTPKKKKLICTSQYIYQALFKEGKGSDVTVIILGIPWRLHKVYLAQSPYFSSMFSGSWKETTEDNIVIKVVDPHINVESLHTVLGSLYLDEITLEPRDVTSILATAALFQLEGIIEQCVEVMIETVNIKTVAGYYDTAHEYSLKKVSETAFRWLLVNLLSYVIQQPDQLRAISPDLMGSLVSSPDLFVMQIEFSVYALLRYWMYLRLNPGSDDPPISTQVFQYFKQRQDKEKEPFLMTPKGEAFKPVFQKLRLNQLVNHHIDIEMLRSDGIIPVGWLDENIGQQWYHMLRIDQGLDRGPQSLGPEEFSSLCLRCGRTIDGEGENVWRWTGFMFGLDLVWTVNARTLRVKRNSRHDNSVEVLLSYQPRRHVMLRVTVASLDEQRQIKHCQATGLQAYTFYRNEEHTLLVFDRDITYPLHISVNLLVTTPLASCCTQAKTILPAEFVPEVPNAQN